MIPETTWTGVVHQTAPGRVIVDVPGLARAIVENDGTVTIHASDDADPIDLDWLRVRPVREAQALLAGRFALRAAAVVIEGAAVALAGYGTQGKSTTAAVLAQRGHGVLADHLLIVDTELVAQPEEPRLDLWPDAVETLGLDNSKGAIVRASLNKRSFIFQGTEPARLSTIILLDRDTNTGGGTQVESLHGGDAIAACHQATAGAVLLDPLGLRARHFHWVARLANGCTVVRLSIDRHLATPENVADAVERIVAK